MGSATDTDTAPDLVAQDDGDPGDSVVMSANNASSSHDLRYHNAGCLRINQIERITRITRGEAQGQGHVPCKDCHPSVDGGVYLSEGVADLIEQVRTQFDSN